MLSNELAPARGRGRSPIVRDEAPATDDVAVAETVQPVKLIEVQLVRKYVPHHVYEVDENRTVPPEFNGDKLVRPGQLFARPVITPDGSLVVERDIVEGETDDKWGRKVPVKKQIMTDYKPGTVISLPADEAKRALKIGVAVITNATFE
jgi:hypothetical protein